MADRCMFPDSAVEGSVALNVPILSCSEVCVSTFLGCGCKLGETKC